MKCRIGSCAGLSLFLMFFTTVGVRADFTTELTVAQIKALDDARSDLKSVVGQCDWLASSEPRTQASTAQHSVAAAIRALEPKGDGPIAEIPMSRSMEFQKMLADLKRAKESLSFLNPIIGASSDSQHQLAHTIPDLKYLEIATSKTPLPPQLTPAMLKAAVEGNDDGLRKMIKEWNATRTGKEPVAVSRYTPLVGASGSIYGGPERVLFSIPGDTTDLLVQVRPPQQELSVIGMEKTEKGPVGWFRDVELKEDHTENPILKVVNNNACAVCHEKSTPAVPYATAIAWQEPVSAFSTIRARAGKYQDVDASTPYDRPLNLTPSAIPAPIYFGKALKLSKESVEKVEKAADCTRCHQIAGGYLYGHQLILRGGMPKDLELTPQEREAAADLYLRRLCDSLREKLQVNALLKSLEPIYPIATKIRDAEFEAEEAKRTAGAASRAQHESGGKSRLRPAKNGTK